MIMPAVCGALTGLIVGSFLATVATRWERDESALVGRSRCDGCGRPLRPGELVPLASFIVQRGRCRVCRAPIDRRHPLMEAGCAALGAAALWVDPAPVGAAGALFGWLLAMAAALDVRGFWLPDRLTGAMAATGLAAGLLEAPPPPADRLIGAVAGWLALLAVAVVYRRLRGRDGLGGGDPKLFGAVGAWLGWQALPAVLLLAALLGLGWCLILLVAGRSVAGTDRLAFGALLALAAWPLWLAGAAS